MGLVKQGIVNGQKDTTHDAVVAIAGSDWACTGTIIEVNGSTGYALTAAHCLENGPPQMVLQADDYAALNAIQYPPTHWQAHPSYNGDVYDFAMIQFGSAGPGTPVIPAMTPGQDGLQIGTQVRHVGYGKTSYPNGETTERHQIVTPLSNLSSLKLTYAQPNGGPCQGDSGGPNLTIGGTERVAGVISNGDEGCDEYGYSGRTSAVYDSFIQPYINNTPITGPQNCDECTQFATTGMGPCSQKVQTCWNHSDCSAMLECFNACDGSNTCIQNCIDDHPVGYDVYGDIFDCVCEDACTLLCEEDLMCKFNGTSTAAATSVAVSTSAATSGGGETTTTTGGGETGVGGASATEGYNAGNTKRQDFDGVLLTSACSLERGVANTTASEPRTAAWTWLAALALTGWRRRRV